MYSISIFYCTLYLLGGAYAPNAPPCLGACFLTPSIFDAGPRNTSLYHGQSVVRRRRSGEATLEWCRPAACGRAWSWRVCDDSTRASDLSGRRCAHHRCLRLNSTTRVRPDPTRPARTRTDPHGLCRRPARTQRSFSETRAAKKSVRVRSGPCSGI